MMDSRSSSSKPLSNGNLPGRAFRTASLHKPGNGRWKALQAISIGAMLFWAGEVQARTCADLYNAIKSEAMYCGFFCDLEQLKPLQEAYKASCIRIVLPLSPFDLDSVPQESAVLAVDFRIDVGAEQQASPALSR
jgi:hypothetical protein